MNCSSNLINKHKLSQKIKEPNKCLISSELHSLTSFQTLTYVLLYCELIFTVDFHYVVLIQYQEAYAWTCCSQPHCL